MAKASKSGSVIQHRTSGRRQAKVTTTEQSHKEEDSENKKTRKPRKQDRQQEDDDSVEECNPIIEDVERGSRRRWKKVAATTLDTYTVLFRPSVRYLGGVTGYFHQGSGNNDVDELIEADLISELGNLMNSALSGARSDDIKTLRNDILAYVALHLGIDSLTPPINAKSSKSTTCRFNHPELGRLLCPTPLVAEYDKNLESFLKKMDDDPEFYVTSEEYPTFMYPPNGFSLDDIDENFSHSNSALLVYVWRHLFLGPSAATDFSLRLRKVGQAVTHGLAEVTPRTISYAAVITRHALSSVDDFRVEDGAFIKYDFFRLIVNAIEGCDPRLPFSRETMQWWNEGRRSSKHSELKARETGSAAASEPAVTQSTAATSAASPPAVAASAIPPLMTATAPAVPLPTTASTPPPTTTNTAAPPLTPPPPTTAAAAIVSSPNSNFTPPSTTPTSAGVANLSHRQPTHVNEDVVAPTHGSSRRRLRGSIQGLTIPPTLELMPPASPTPAPLPEDDTEEEPEGEKVPVVRARKRGLNQVLEPEPE
ncbi:hypothetical protein K435DRAFT_966736 [Dendrothele bispora CBS 962.96]|uniref:Uncharacterized protein n=1 Tax=Dendrothele bispora (strain CBS 962.96) TaxID=1314807 RepID=A0A4S8LZM0_DENBC|nr:hypothetical protein K435DRAFT_966736 [Dendrothele bispora CBS 962.96]